MKILAKNRYVILQEKHVDIAILLRESVITERIVTVLYLK